MSSPIARPITSYRPAGYTSNPGKKKWYSEIPQEKKSVGASLLRQEKESSLEDHLRQAEQDCIQIVEESACLQYQNQLALALEKSQEAWKKCTWIHRQRLANFTPDEINHDIEYLVLLNLGNVQEANNLLRDALKTYQQILQLRTNPNHFKIHLNIGNLHVKLNEYSQAIKNYRMVLDKMDLENNRFHATVRFSIARTFFAMGLYIEAAENFTSALQAYPEPKTAFLLLLCHYARGDKSKMQSTFHELVRLALIDKSEHYRMIAGSYNSGNGDGKRQEDVDMLEMHHSTSVLDTDSTISDILHHIDHTSLKYITQAAKLIVFSIASTPLEGYSLLFQTLQSFAPPVAHSPLSSPLPPLSCSLSLIITDLTLHKASYFLQHQQYSKMKEAVQSLAAQHPHYEKLLSSNLAFFHILEHDFPKASQLSLLSLQHERYSASAIVNSAICHSHLEQYSRAKNLLLESIGIDSLCINAIFNLGLVNKELFLADRNSRSLQDAIIAFEKLFAIRPDVNLVVYQLAVLYEWTGDYQKSVEYYLRLIKGKDEKGERRESAEESEEREERIEKDGDKLRDANIYVKLGELYNKMKLYHHSYNYYYEGYLIDPMNVSCLSSLGLYELKNNNLNKAIHYFQLCCQATQHSQIKWMLMLASCQRRIGNVDKAIELYEEIFDTFYDDLEAAKFLIVLLKERNRPIDKYLERIKNYENSNKEEDEEESPLEVDYGRPPYIQRDMGGRGEKTEWRRDESEREQEQGRKGGRWEKEEGDEGWEREGRRGEYSGRERSEREDTSGTKMTWNAPEEVKGGYRDEGYTSIKQKATYESYSPTDQSPSNYPENLKSNFEVPMPQVQEIDKFNWDKRNQMNQEGEEEDNIILPGL